MKESQNGVLLSTKDDVRKLIDSLEECVELNPFIAEPHTLLAQCYYNVKNHVFTNLILNMSNTHWTDIVNVSTVEYFEKIFEKEETLMLKRRKISCKIILILD